MKKIFCLLLSATMVFLIQNTYAQSNYYPNESGIIIKEGYTYKYDSFFFATKLYNANSIYNDVEEKNRDGSKISKAMALGKGSVIDEASATRQQIFDFVSSLFTPAQKAILKHKLIISVAIDPLTGKIVDVYFLFPTQTTFSKIPVDVYRRIEIGLKMVLVFKINDEGRKLNYILETWAQEIK